MYKSKIDRATAAGAAAGLVQKNYLIIIASYAEYSEEELENFESKLVFINEKN